jgi:hypothetical protein
MAWFTGFDADQLACPDLDSNGPCNPSSADRDSTDSNCS